MSGDPEDEQEEEVDCTLARAALADCDATLGEIEDCVSQQLAMRSREMAGWRALDCSNTIEDIANIGGDTDLSPACDELQQECPILFE